MNNSDSRTFRVLVACEESQAISGEIRRFARTYGYNIQSWSCDLLPTSAPESEEDLTGPRFHLRGDVTAVLAYDERYDYEDLFITSHKTDDQSLVTHKETLDEVLEFLKINQSWDMIIANPPCTYLAVSGARWYHDTKNRELDYNPKFPMRKVERAESMRFFMTIAMAPCKYIVLENPVGTLKTNLLNADYNIGSAPVGYFPPDDTEEKFEEKFTEDVSLEDLKARESYVDIIDDFKSKKLPKWSELSSLNWRGLASISGLDLSEHDGGTLYSKYTVQAIQPYYFGDSASKKTCFWFKGISDKLTPLISEDQIQQIQAGEEEAMLIRTRIPNSDKFDEETVRVTKGEMVQLSSGKTLPKWYSDALTKAKSTEERRTLRSKTFASVSREIVRQWVLSAAYEERVISKADWEIHQNCFKPLD